MPPLRTPKKATAKTVGTLSAFGFVPVTKQESRARPGRSCIKPPAPAPDTTQVTDLEGDATPEKPSHPAPARTNAFKALKKGAVIGVSKASFNHESQWQERAEIDIGSSTKMISFGGHFALKPPKLCAGLEYFTFNYDDV
ncbi:unnamed protein product [Clonostachys rosea]|uniref:Uncharacterized protein n=1 Tax=Bionectria ochroleuca TaxID=29856 RepID=A0ABY6U1H4_BIOOC|nr:unnamed protein product [Clonostachys rosea]